MENIFSICMTRKTTDAALARLPGAMRYTALGHALRKQRYAAGRPLFIIRHHHK
jgi:hypothetical protein